MSKNNRVFLDKNRYFFLSKPSYVLKLFHFYIIENIYNFDVRRFFIAELYEKMSFFTFWKFQKLFSHFRAFVESD